MPRRRRSVADNVISGYAATFNDEIVYGNYWREKIAPGAFTRTLKEQPDVLMLLDHDSGRVLGRTSAGSLTLREDRVGLYFACTIDPSTPEGQTAGGAVGRQDLKNCSFGFRVRSEVWQDGEEKLPLRILTDVDLFEVSIVAFPAYPTTSASLRASTNNQAARRRIEAAQRKRGILK
ncbi:phage prohead protein [Bradyrhizobium liaoningense]|nr:phage prohead protein [Bradyrhizobium liaoningense]